MTCPGSFCRGRNRGGRSPVESERELNIPRQLLNTWPDTFSSWKGRSHAGALSSNPDQAPQHRSALPDLMDHVRGSCRREEIWRRKTKRCQNACDLQWARHSQEIRLCFPVPLRSFLRGSCRLDSETRLQHKLTTSLACGPSPRQPPMPSSIRS